MYKVLILILSFFLFGCDNEGELVQQPSKENGIVPNSRTTNSIQDKTKIDSSVLFSHSNRDTVNKIERNNLVPEPFYIDFYDPLNRNPPTVEEQSKGIKLKITWVDSIHGDFSFTEIPYEKTDFLHLSFPTIEEDSLFKARIARMRNDDNQIIQDSMETYLSLVDTSLHYSIYSEEVPYGGTQGTALMSFSQIKSTISGVYGDIFGNSMNIVIENNTVSAWTVWNVINSQGAWNSVQPLAGGYINIDRNLYKKGIIKAEFDFSFESTQNWKGLLYSKVHK